MEFSLISLPTYTLYYYGYVLILPWSSCYSSHVIPCDCDLWLDHLWPPVTPLWHCDKVTWYFPMLHLVVVSPKKKKKKRKEKKRNINNNLAILPSHDSSLPQLGNESRLYKINSRREPYLGNWLSMGFDNNLYCLENT